MTAINRVPRSRGALSGALLILLGTWGALAPFVGPYMDFGYAPANDPWIWTEGRGLLQVLPGAAAALAGLILLTSASRLLGAFAGGIAALAGAWFVTGQTFTALWDGPTPGAPLGDIDQQVAEQLTFFTGLGVLIVYCAALALGRFAVVGVRETRIADKEALAAQAPYDAAPAPYEPAPAPEPEAEPEPLPQRRRTEAAVPAGRYALDRPEEGDQYVAGPRHTRPDL